MRKLLLLVTILSMPTALAADPSYSDYLSRPYVLSDEERSMIAQYAAASVAQEVCRDDGVRANAQYFRDFASQYMVKDVNRSKAFRAAQDTSKQIILTQIASEGADDWCLDYTSNIFWNFEPENTPAFYNDELGIFGGGY